MQQEGQCPRPRREPRRPVSGRQDRGERDERAGLGSAKGPTEGVWVTQALDGDQRAFTCLVDAYKIPIYNLCYRMLGTAAEAEDAAQETFVRIYTRLKTYDRRQKLSSWILAVASHYCIDRLRRRRINWLSISQVPPIRLLPANQAQPEDVSIGRESRKEIKNLLQSLSPEHRIVITLRYWQDLSYVEIAEVLGATESAIKSRLHRARRILARQLIAQGELGSAPEDRVHERKRMAENALL